MRIRTSLLNLIIILICWLAQSSLQGGCPNCNLMGTPCTHTSSCANNLNIKCSTGGGAYHREICEKLPEPTWHEITETRVESCFHIKQLNPSSRDGYYSIEPAYRDLMVTHCIFESDGEYTMLTQKVQSSSQVFNVSIPHNYIYYNRILLKSEGWRHSSSSLTTPKAKREGISLFGLVIQFGTKNYIFQQAKVAIDQGCTDPYGFKTYTDIPLYKIVRTNEHFGICECYDGELLINLTQNCMDLLYMHVMDHQFLTAIYNTATTIYNVSISVYGGIKVTYPPRHFIIFGDNQNIISVVPCDELCDGCVSIRMCTGCLPQSVSCPYDDYPNLFVCSLTCSSCIRNSHSTYLGSSSTCLECDSSCDTCSGSGPDRCKSCHINQVLCPNYPNGDTGTCLNNCNSNCRDLVNYETTSSLGTNTSNGHCLVCNSMCGDCSGNTANNCTKCSNVEYKLCNHPGFCVEECDSCQMNTKNTYPSTNFCSACHDDCDTCMGGDDNQCLTCPTQPFATIICRPNSGASQGTCVANCNLNCITTLGHTYYDLPGLSCQDCHSSCERCSGNSETHCIACEGTNVVCPTILNGPDGDCLPDCSDACFQSPLAALYINKTNGGGKIISIFGVQLVDISGVNQGMCVVCDASCATCDGPLPEDCLTCKSEYYRCNNVYCIYQCLFCQIQSNNTYPVPSDSASEGFCAACNDGCFKCIGEGDMNCTECFGTGVGNSKLCQKTDIGVGCCVASCEDDCQISTLFSYYDTMTDKCQNCSSECATCMGSQETDCLTCATGEFKCNLTAPILARCVDDCTTECTRIDSVNQTNTYKGTNAECLDCNTDCTISTCRAGKIKACKSCGGFLCSHTSMSLPNVLGECSNCLNCDIGSKHTYQSFDDPYFCRECNDLCNTCEGPNYDNCLTCFGTDLVCNGVCQENCVSCRIETNQTYSDGVTCRKCHEDCLKCINSGANQCLTCPTGTALCPKFPTPLPNGECVSSCDKYCIFASAPYGSYEYSGECKICHSTCFRCNGPSKNSCTWCTPQFKLQPNIFLHNPLPTGYCTTALCIDGTFPNSTVDRGIICHNCIKEGCKCSDIGTDCHSCLPTYFYYNATCLNVCPEDYYGNQITQICIRIEKICGDGKRHSSEECDDGNKIESGDGCTNLCEIEDGWFCDHPGPSKTSICHCSPLLSAASYAQKWTQIRINFNKAIKVSINSNDESSTYATGVWNKESCDIFEKETVESLGQKFLCQIEVESININLGWKTTLPRETSVKLKPDVIGSANPQCTEYFEDREIHIEEESSTLTPIFSLEIPAEVNNCERININLMYPEGSGLREYKNVKYEVISISHTNPEYTLTTKEIGENRANMEHLNSVFADPNNYNRNSDMEKYIPKDILLREREYIIEVSLTNFLDETTSKQKSLRSVEVPAPSVSIEGIPEQEGEELRGYKMHVWSKLKLRANTNQFTCLNLTQGNNNEIITHWTLKKYGDQYNENITSISKSLNYYELPQNTLRPGKYVLSVFAYEESTPEKEGSSKILLEIIESAILGRISGGISQEWPNDRELVLNGNSSIDPDTGNNTGMQAKWSCKNITEKNATISDCHFTNSTNFHTKQEWGPLYISLPVESFTRNQIMRFTMNVKKGDRVGVASVIVNMVDSKPFYVLIERITLPKSRSLYSIAGEDLVLRAKVVEARNDDVEYLWTFSIEYTNNTQFKTGVNKQFIRIPKELLNEYPGGFEVKVKVWGGEVESYASYLILGGTPPQGGLLQIFPEEGGRGMETDFELKAENWYTENPPLNYVFSYILEDPNANSTANNTLREEWQVIRSESPSAYLLTKLPQGLKERDYSIWIKVQIEDCFGLSATLIKDIKVMPYQGSANFTYEKAIEEMIMNIPIKDYQKALTNLQLTSNAIIAKTIPNNPEINITTKMRDMFNYSLPDTLIETEQYYQIITNIIKSNSTYSDTQQSMTIEIANSLLQSHPEFSDFQVGGLTTILDTLINNMRESNKNSSKGAGELGETCAKRLLENEIFGEEPRVFKSENFELIGQKIDSSKGLNMEIGEYSLSSTPLKTALPQHIIDNQILIQDLSLRVSNKAIYNWNEIAKNNMKSKVVSINLDIPKVVDGNSTENTSTKTNDISFTLPVLLSNLSQSVTDNLECTYFDQTQKKFISEGLSIVEKNISGNYFICLTNHLSDFAVARDVTKIISDANFEEATSFEELANYVWYKSGIFWFSVIFSLFCLGLYTWAYSHDRKAIILEHTFIKRFKYLHTDLVFGKNSKQIKQNKESKKLEKKRDKGKNKKIKKKREKEKKVEEIDMTTSAVVATEGKILEDSERPKENITQNNWINNDQKATKCAILIKTISHSHKVLGLCSYYDPKFLRTSRVLLFWSQIILILISSGLFYNFSSGEAMSKGASLTSKILIGIICVIFTVPFALLMSVLLKTKAETDFKVIERKNLIYGAQGIPFEEINEGMQKKDKKKVIVAYIIGTVLGITGMILSNTLAASFGVEKANDWLVTFSFSLVYDLLIHQVIKGFLIFLMVMVLGGSTTACGSCRKLCLRLISKSLLELMR